MDYKSLHLTWLSSHRNFVPKNHHLYNGLPYHEIMEYIYRRPDCSQDCAKNFFDADLEWNKQSVTQIAEVTKALYKNDPRAPVFFTIGFNHQTWDIPSCVKVIQKICSFDWIQSIRAVFELHRDNGLHPHCHMLIVPSVPLTKSKMIEKVWAAAGIKKVCLKKSFLDYKVASDYHHKYILGEKQENKMKYVEQDIAWREKNGIPQYFEK